jgi:hypothetical protein
MLATINARDVTRIVRDERLRLGLVLLGVTLHLGLLSMFLARPSRCRCAASPAPRKRSARPARGGRRAPPPAGATRSACSPARSPT